MQITPYSAPEFDPYGDNASDTPEELWPAPTATQPIDAVVEMPGSKSLTNRELVLSALADGTSQLRSPLHSQDSHAMVEALRSLGASVNEINGRGRYGTDWRVEPGELFGSTTIDCGLAGTVMRFVPPLAALALGPTVFDANPAARSRPMGSLIDALRKLGVDIDDDGRKTLPFTVHGTGSVHGGEVTIDASSSSQFVSALLLSASKFDNGLVLRHQGGSLPSTPHIDMTIAVLERRGVAVLMPEPGTWIIAPGTIQGADVDIEPDLSNAAPFLAAALVTGGRVTVNKWPETTTQAGAALVDILPAFGAQVTRNGTRLTVEASGPITGVDLNLATAGELVPTIAALAALANSPSRITGIGHIRHHETDRLEALATEINRIGGSITVEEDGLLIQPAPLHGGQWRTYNDHRMATTGALIGLAVADIDIHNVATVAKTLPQFTELWHEMIRPS